MDPDRSSRAAPTPDTHAASTTRASTSIVAWSACALLIALAAWWWHACGTCDDDYIVYRYAERWILGDGLVFNSGERVEGFTCPLWLIAIAGAHAVKLSPVVASQALGFASLFACAIGALVMWRARRVTSEESATDTRARRESYVWCAVAIASSAALGFHAAAGLGTALAAALLATSYVLARRADERAASSWSWALACAAVAALVRPETIVFTLVLGACAPERFRPRTWLPAVLLLGAWSVFRWSYYGTWLPLTYHAKELPLADDLAYGAAYVWRATLDTGFALFVGVCLVARLRGAALRERSASAALFGLVGATCAVVFVGGDYLPLARFVVPLVPLSLLLLADVLATWRPIARRGAWCAALVLGAWPLVQRDELRVYHEFNERRWIAIGRELARRADPATRVASSAVGAIGYHSRLPIVDMLGLTDPALAHAPPDLSIEWKGHQRHDAELVLARRPDVIVLGNGVMQPGERRLVVSAWEEELFRDPRFARDYAPRSIEVEGSYPLLYFERKGGLRLSGSRDATTR